MSNFGLPNKPGDNNPNLPQTQVPWVYGQIQKLQAKRIKLSSIQIKNPGTVSGIATVTGTIGAGSTQVITNTLTPNSPHGSEMNFAIPFISIYEGTTNITNNLIYPGIGANKSWGSYSFQSSYDWDKFANTTPGSVISVIVTTIHNNMGASGTYFYISQFKYLNLNNGTVT